MTKKLDPLISYIFEKSKFVVGQKCKFKLYRDELHNKISTEDWETLTNGKMFYWHNGIIGSVIHKTHLRDYEIVMCDSPLNRYG